MPQLFTLSLLVLGLTVGSARLAAAQSLFIIAWTVATPATVQALLNQGASPTAQDRRNCSPSGTNTSP